MSKKGKKFGIGGSDEELVAFKRWLEDHDIKPVRVPKKQTEGFFEAYYRPKDITRIESEFFKVDPDKQMLVCLNPDGEPVAVPLQAAAEAVAAAWEELHPDDPIDPGFIQEWTGLHAWKLDPDAKVH